MTGTTDLAARLAATAAGTWGEEAAVWLLAQHGHWLPELDRIGLIQLRLTPDPDEIATVILWPTVDLLAPDAEWLLIGTNGERQILSIARALAGGMPTSTSWLHSLDEQNRRLVLHAIGWAAGGRHWAETLRLVPRSTFECEVCTKPITAYPCVLCEQEPLGS